MSGIPIFQLQKLMTAPSAEVTGKTFYVGDYKPIEVGAFARSIAQEFGVRPPVSVPPWLLSLVARVGDCPSVDGVERRALDFFSAGESEGRDAS